MSFVELANRKEVFETYVSQLPVRANTVFYMAYRNKIMSGNPYAIFQELVSQPDFDDYQHYWAYGKDSYLDYDTFSRYASFPNVHLVEAQSTEYIEAMATCQYVINNSAMPNYWFKRDEQIYVNTWHGTPLKSIGLDAKDFKEASVANAQRNFLMCDYLVMPNTFTAERIMDAYDLRDLLSATVLTEGYPRNDLVLNTNKDHIIGLLEHKIGHKLDGKKIVLYAPTFRSSSGTSLDTAAELSESILEMTSQAPDGFEFFFKTHNMMEKYFANNTNLGSRLLFDEIETNELLSVVDVLITDYSSIFFDFLCTGRPCLFFCYDRKEYTDQHGLYLETGSLPGDVCESVDQLVDSLATIQDGTYYKLHSNESKHAQYVSEFAAHDDGHATERIVDTIFRKSGLTTGQSSHASNTTNSLDKANKEAVIVYAGNLHSLYKQELLEMIFNSKDLFDQRILVVGSGIEIVPYVFQSYASHVSFIFSKINSTDSSDLAHWKKYFTGIAPICYITLTPKDLLCDCIECCFPGTKKYAIFDTSDRRFVELKKDDYKDIYLVAQSDEERALCNEVEATVINLDAMPYRQKRLNVLFLANYDSMNTAFIACVEELRKRGHDAAVVVANAKDKTNNKAFMSRNIPFVDIKQYRKRDLKGVDIVVVTPLVKGSFTSLLNNAYSQGKFIVSFASLFSSIAMRVRPDMVLSIGPSKIKEFSDNYLQYNTISIGCPQYDDLIKKHHTLTTKVKTALIIDQGGYPYGATGKEQFASAIKAIAKNNPEIEFHLRPRYTEADVKHTLHTTSEFLVDFLDDSPDNLIVVSNTRPLEEIFFRYDAMITAWSSAYLAALALNVPILFLKGFDSVDVFDVRIQRINQAFDSLEPSGLVVDYHDVMDSKITWKTLPPEYTNEVFYRPLECSAPKVVDYFEHVKQRLLIPELRYKNRCSYTFDEYFEVFDTVVLEDASNEAYCDKTMGEALANDFMQEAVFINRCMGQVLDLSPLQAIYDEAEITPSDLEAYEQIFLNIERDYFSKATTSDILRNDKILQDFYFQWLYETAQYEKIGACNFEVLARSSQEYYLALTAKNRENRLAYQHLVNYFNEVLKADIIQLVVEKRIARMVNPFRETTMDKIRLLRACSKNRVLRALHLAYGNRVYENSIYAAFLLRELVLMEKFEDALKGYKAYKRAYRESQKRAKKRTKRKFRSFPRSVAKRICNWYIERLVKKSGLEERAA